MGFNEFLSSIFGNKSTRDMKEIQPWVEKIKAAYPEVAKLDNDALRAKTEELKAYTCMNRKALAACAFCNRIARAPTEALNHRTPRK